MAGQLADDIALEPRIESHLPRRWKTIVLLGLGRTGQCEEG